MKKPCKRGGKPRPMGEVENLYLCEYTAPPHTQLLRCIISAYSADSAEVRLIKLKGGGIILPHAPRVITRTDAQAALSMFAGIEAACAELG